MTSSKAYRVRIEGRVQGVCFRYYTEQEANRLGITGWVRNCSDGSVEALICGDEQPLQMMLAWLKHGPSSAVVSQTKVEPITAEPIPTSFRITS